jgi:hypothetical protein
MRTVFVGPGLVASLGLVMLLGCAKSGLKTHPVAGKVEVQDGDVAPLVASHVELMQDADPLLRPSGKIDSSGRFTIQTLSQGKLHEGAPEGTYHVRIVLADQSDEGVPKRIGDPVHKRFLDFDKSALTLAVPSGDYTIRVAKK